MSNACINSKLITQEEKFEIDFHGVDIPLNNGVETSTILKMVTNKVENIIHNFL